MLKHWFTSCTMYYFCLFRNKAVDTGRFGVNCTKTCDHCKNSETCGIERGECDALGCADSGFQPPMYVGKRLE